LLNSFEKIITTRSTGGYDYFDIKIHLMSLSSPFKSEKCWQVFTIRVQS